MILVEAHNHVVGGHYIGKYIVHKILREGLWCPTLNKDAKEYCRYATYVRGLENCKEGMRCH